MMRLAGLIAVLAASLVLGGCDGAEDNPDVVKIAVAGPVTGQYASFGTQMTNGAEQAVADINSAGGVLGKKLDLEVGDDACDPKQAVAVANHLAGQGVALVAGHFCSGSSIPASKRLCREQGGDDLAGVDQPGVHRQPARPQHLTACAAATISKAASPAPISPNISATRTSPSSTTRPPTAKVWPTR